MSSSYKLYYFDLKAKVEVARLLFAASGQKYEDIRYSYGNKEEWLKHKDEMPFRQVPVLEVIESDGTRLKIAQSGAIYRYLANKFNMAGKTERERAVCDMICEEVRDIHELIFKIYVKPSGEAKEAELNEAMSRTIPDMLKLIENMLEANVSGFLVGDSITYADLYLMYVYEWLHDRRGEILAKLPVLKAHDEKIRSYPGVKEHLEWNVVNNVRTSTTFG